MGTFEGFDVKIDGLVADTLMRTMALMRAMAFFGLSFVLSACAFNSDSTQSRLAELEARVSSDQLIQIVNSFQQLQQSQATLQGQVDNLSKEVADLKKSQDNLFSDLDSRLAALESNKDGSSSSSTGGAKMAYDNAIRKLQSRDFRLAEAQLADFIKNYPDQIPEARYWYAISQSANSKTGAAIESLEDFINKYPDNPFNAQALVALADAYLSTSQLAKAKSTYQIFLSKYPNNPLSTRVRENLSKL